MGKKYWWLKLPEDFFRQLEIKKLRRIAGGDTYTIIYLKMMLLSLKTEGCIAYDCSEEDFVENLALDIDEDEDNVSMAVAFLMKNGLLQRTDKESERVLPKAVQAIGSETAGAMRVREFRARQKALQCNTDVTEAKQVGNVEIEKELEIEKDIDIKSSSSYSPSSSRCDDDDDEWKTIVSLWNSNIMPITPLVGEKLKALSDEVGYAAVEQAITKAVEHGARNFAYVQACARNIAAGNNKPEKKELLF